LYQPISMATRRGAFLETFFIVRKMSIFESRNSHCGKLRASLKSGACNPIQTLFVKRGTPKAQWSVNLTAKKCE
ncbi:MAG: hypothetical protein ACKOF3_03130, partial [Spartobacteria bacterium]